MFVRHTLNAIYTNLGIELCMVRRQSPPRLASQPHPRELRVSIGLLVSGRARLTGQPAEWRVYVPNPIDVTVCSDSITVVTQRTLLNRSTPLLVIIGSIQSFPSLTAEPLTSYEEPWMPQAQAWLDSAHHFQFNTAKHD